LSHKSLLPEDIAVLARRRRLGAEETVRLDELAKDPAEAALARVGRAFDAQDIESDRDDALASRMAEHALSASVRVPREVSTKPIHSVPSSSRIAGRSSLLRMRKRGVLIAAAMGLAAAAAAGTGRYVVLTRTARLHATAAAPSTSPPRESPARPRRAAPAVDQPTDDVDEAIGGVIETPSVVESARPLRDQDVHPPTAELLFSRGNGARRGGRIGEAVGNYEQLLGRFPDSSEAQMARVSLGNVLLDQGRAGRALSLFDMHLARGGQLAEEALYGKARALRALGRLTEERQVWQLLATRYPNSIYARSARERLGLDR
jgi:TolA-binding protein